MAEEKKKKQSAEKGTAAGKSAAGKPTAKKAPAKKSPAKKADKERADSAEVFREKRAADETSTSAPKGEKETVEEKVHSEAEKEARNRPEADKERELNEEEIRRLVEESLEKVTVADIVLNMMNQMASVGYLKMGLPEAVNLKYRDLDQARLAIDVLEAMVKGSEGKVPEETLKPFRGTLANLQMNFVQLRTRAGGA